MGINELLAADNAELETLLSQVFKSLGADVRDVEQIYKNVDLLWARLAMHIRAENLHLFPAVLQCLNKLAENEKIPYAALAENLLKKLKDDHNFFMRELTGVIKKLRELGENECDGSEQANALSDVCSTILGVERRMKTHNELEETHIYEWAETLLDESEHAALLKQIRRELENSPPRFG
jgi:hypothetical protein